MLNYFTAVCPSLLAQSGHIIFAFCLNLSNDHAFTGTVTGWYKCSIVYVILKVIHVTGMHIDSDKITNLSKQGPDAFDLCTLVIVYNQSLLHLYMHAYFQWPNLNNYETSYNFVIANINIKLGYTIALKYIIKIILILRRSMLSIRLDRPGKHMLIFPRVVTMPSLCDHSVRHPLHSESVLPSVSVSHIHWSPIQVLTLLEVA